MYQIGDLVVYGSMGVCRVDGFSHPDSGNSVLFYCLSPLYQSGVIHTPVESEKVPLRPIMTTEAAEALLAQLPTIQVEIYKDGALAQTVTLSSANNWSYAWTDPGQSVWTVVERDVPEGYTVHTDEKDTTFIITNQWNPATPDQPDEPIDPPDTGDVSPLWLYVLVLCLSGLGLVIVGLALLRGNRYEKKRQ